MWCVPKDRRLLEGKSVRPSRAACRVESVRGGAFDPPIHSCQVSALTPTARSSSPPAIASRARAPCWSHRPVAFRRKLRPADLVLASHAPLLHSARMRQTLCRGENGSASTEVAESPRVGGHVAVSVGAACASAWESPAGVADDIAELYRALGGRAEVSKLRPGAWDLAFADGLILELDEELHFNRYRRQALQAASCAPLPWRDEYLQLCEARLIQLPRGWKVGQTMDGSVVRRVMFGEAGASGNLEQAGAPRWKQRAALRHDQRCLRARHRGTSRSHLNSRLCRWCRDWRCAGRARSISTATRWWSSYDTVPCDNYAVMTSSTRVTASTAMARSWCRRGSRAPGRSGCCSLRVPHHSQHRKHMRQRSGCSRNGSPPLKDPRSNSVLVDSLTAHTLGLVRGVMREQGQEQVGLAASGAAFWMIISAFPTAYRRCQRVRTHRQPGGRREGSRRPRGCGTRHCMHSATARRLSNSASSSVSPGSPEALRKPSATI